jgi:hypothetical protein
VPRTASSLRCRCSDDQALPPKTKSIDLQVFRDAGGGTRTPDTRIMIGSIEPNIPHFAEDFVLLDLVLGGHICVLGDKIRDKVGGRSRRRRADPPVSHATRCVDTVETT